MNTRDPDELIRITKDSFELTKKAEFEKGYLLAVKALMTKKDTNSSYYAEWLLRNRHEILGEEYE